MSKAPPVRPTGNNHDVSRGRVTSDEEASTTTERPEGIPNVRTERIWDDKIDGEQDGPSNLKRQSQDTPAALETHEPGATPSRKSTRGSTSHLKGATSKTTAVKAQVRSPSARAQRSQTKR
ncbi:MAG: hypothetical protein JWM10_37 [Myxococcaceae bacterium]|nr:hypothetical protein [Myxococcaceae bacterium]